MKRELPNNLRLGSDGIIYCEDRQDVGDYILQSPLGKERELPSDIVILTREDFFKLCVHAAWLDAHLIHAA